MCSTPPSNPDKSPHAKDESSSKRGKRSKKPKLDVNQLIKDLMNCVSRDGTGKLVVKDYLTDPSIIQEIIARAIPVMQGVKSMLSIHAPIFVVGDLHGQFTDLLRIFEMCGKPEDTTFLFLGDYVDRGPNSLETICLLLLLKIRYPWRVHLLRGNHECSSINRTHGFSDECEDRFQKIPIIETVWGVKATELKGNQIWLKFQELFNWLPFTALINERILCMHGGLSPSLRSIDQLLSIRRPTDPCTDIDLTTDLLWSDPDPAMPSGETDPEWGPSNRGVSSRFNSKAVKSICSRLNLDMIVRAHQCVQEGYEFFANRKLVTIFSAPNYCGEYNNSGAVMQLDENLLISFKVLKPVAGTPHKKKKAMEVNVDDVDLDSLLKEDSTASDDKMTSEKSNSTSSDVTTPNCSPKRD